MTPRVALLYIILHLRGQVQVVKSEKNLRGHKRIPHLVTHDAHTIHYPDPLIKVNDTIQIDLETGKIAGFIKFDTGTLVTYVW